MVAKGPCFTGATGAVPGREDVRGVEPLSNDGGSVVFFICCGGDAGERAAGTGGTAPSAGTTTVVVFVQVSPSTSN